MARAKRPAEELVEAGAQKVFYAIATESADSDLTQRALPQALSRAMVPDTVSLVNMGGWNDDPNLVQALQDALARIEERT